MRNAYADDTARDGIDTTMKLHLPHTLRVALVACFAMLPTLSQAATDISTGNIWDTDPSGDWQWATVSGDLTVTQTLDLSSRALQWNGGNAATLSGNATIASLSGPELDRGYIYASGGSLTIEEGVALSNVDIESNAAMLKIKGKITGDVWFDVMGGTMDLSAATLDDSRSHFQYVLYGGGTLNWLSIR